MLPVPHPGDRSFACVPVSLGSPPRRQSTTRSSAPPAIVQTSVRAHWLPCPHALWLLVMPDRGRTSPLLHSARVASLAVLQFRYPHMGSFLPGLGWLQPPKSTRAWDPTLLWNHYTHNRAVLSVNACFATAIRLNRRCCLDVGHFSS